MAGIYIHIPYCKKACSYCNFHFSTQLKNLDRMFHALMKEIELQKSWMPIQEEVKTIYFGGGTPSLLPPEYTARLIEQIAHHYHISADPEITLEANPDDISTEKLKQWKTSGINRFSIGIQSFDDAELKWMNRAHNASESLHCLDLIKEAGFDNISADLIFGSDFCSNEQLVEHANVLIGKKIPHISCYALTAEEKTRFGHDILHKKAIAPDPEKQAEQFYLLSDLLALNGYEQYEISNYARQGCRSRHNSNYWNGTPYIGIGPSAHSFDGMNLRKWNVANNEMYIRLIENKETCFEEERLSVSQIINEYLMTALRRTEGIDLKKLSSLTSKEQQVQIMKELGNQIQKGWIEQNEHSARLSRSGKIMADGIAAALFID